MNENKKPKYGYEYPRPAVTTDCVIFGFDINEGIMKMLLIERGLEPYIGKMALPGGFIKIQAKTNKYGFVMEETNESLEDCARRELAEETGLEVNYMDELGTWSTPGRDPRCITITAAYYALVTLRPVKGGDDARDARWVPLDQVRNAIEHMPDGMPLLAFDHDQIVKKALERLRREICFEPIAFKLLPERFSMPMLQKIYESILGRTFDRRNFARKMLDAEILDVADLTSKAIFYSFNRQKYDEFMANNRISNLIF